MLSNSQAIDNNIRWVNGCNKSNIESKIPQKVSVITEYEKDGSYMKTKKITPR